MSEPVMTLRWIDDDDEEQPDPAKVYWTAPTEDGYHVSLMSIPDVVGYTIARHGRPFTDGQATRIRDLEYPCIELGRPDAGQLAVALITALINNSDQIINTYIAERMANR
jgi:hypothetical protein